MGSRGTADLRDIWRHGGAFEGTGGHWERGGTLGGVEGHWRDAVTSLQTSRVRTLNNA